MELSTLDVAHGKAFRIIIWQLRHLEHIAYSPYGDALSISLGWVMGIVQYDFHIKCVILTVIWRVSQVEQELLTLPEYLSLRPGFSGVRVGRSFVSVWYLSFFLWPLYYLYIFYIRLLITFGNYGIYNNSHQHTVV